MDEITHEVIQIRIRNYAKVILFPCLFAFLFVWFSASVAQAATLYLSPSSGSYTVGSTFSVNVYISSAEQAMNAASGIISFPQDKLEATSLSKNGSIFALWVQEPSFSNAAGTINFEGIVLNPGFTGATGKIISVNFRVKAAGVSTLNFSSGSVLANDGKGTNILTGLGNASFSLNAAGAVGPQAPESITPSVITDAPLAPKISSPTHPNPEEWYNNSNPKFTWQVPADVTAVRLLYDKFSGSQPKVIYSPPISEKELEDIPDGIWYFHVQLRNGKGWGGISHFKFQIDTEPPEPFSIKFVHGQEGIDPSPIITFNTTDTLSGTNYYRIKIGEGDFLKLDPDLIISNPYALPPQAPGQRTVLAQAFDMAGNMTSAAEEFTILPLQAPTITYYPKEVEGGDLLEIRGTTYPDASVDIFLKKEGEEIIKQTTRSNSSGDFTLIWSPKLTNGLYGMWTQVTDNRGAKSYESPPLTIVVKSSAVFQIGSFVINYLSIIFLLISVLFALMIGCWYMWHRFTLFRKRLGKEVREAEETLHKAFDFLKDDIKDQIKLLERTKIKRQLTEEEEKIMNQLKKNLEKAEKTIRKEIEDIEKEIK